MSEFDNDRKRPLEFLVHNVLDEGGRSERDANENGRYTADALVLVRAFIDDEQLTISTQSIEGKEFGPISTEMLFRLWLAQGAYLIKESKGEDTESLRIKNFVKKVFLLLEIEPEPTSAAVDQEQRS